MDKLRATPKCCLFHLENDNRRFILRLGIYKATNMFRTLTKQDENCFPLIHV